MARSLNPSAATTFAYHGEVWTDARGYATVRSPAEWPWQIGETPAGEPSATADNTEEGMR